MHALGVIFDMDGVIVDNADYHFQAWQEASRRHGIQLSEAEYQRSYNGRPMKEILRLMFGPQMSEAEGQEFEDEKEALYRELYRPHIQPVPGLVDFLHSLRAAYIPCAVATSAPSRNVDFTLENTHTRRFFEGVVDASMVKRGKPHPEVFLKAADLLNILPHKCVVFEDALMGIAAAKAAGMKVVGVATTHPASELSQADYVIGDFTELNLKILRSIAAQ